MYVLWPGRTLPVNLSHSASPRRPIGGEYIHFLSSVVPPPNLPDNPLWGCYILSLHLNDNDHTLTSTSSHTFFTHQTGADTYHGQNTHTIPCRNHLQVTNHSNVCWVSNLHCFHGQNCFHCFHGLNTEDILDPALTMDYPEQPAPRPQGRFRHPAPPRVRSRLWEGWLCYKCGL